MTRKPYISPDTEMTKLLGMRLMALDGISGHGGYGPAPERRDPMF